MKAVFADTGYWIALFNPRDRLHSMASTRRWPTTSTFNRLALWPFFVARPPRISAGSKASRAGESLDSLVPKPSNSTSDACWMISFQKDNLLSSTNLNGLAILSKSSDNASFRKSCTLSLLCSLLKSCHKG